VRCEAELKRGRKKRDYCTGIVRYQINGKYLCAVHAGVAAIKIVLQHNIGRKVDARLPQPSNAPQAE